MFYSSEVLVSFIEYLSVILLVKSRISGSEQGNITGTYTS